MASQDRSPQSKDILQPDCWMKSVLLLAAAYNLIWGAVAVIAPITMLSWLGLDPLPIYPTLWQALGMVIGVYGIGYAIAATNPYQHWPIILVGFLGKVFGPLGFVWAWSQGTLPASFGWINITNDLIWWIPFGAILFKAARAHQSGRTVIQIQPCNDNFDPFQHATSQHGQTLRELSRRKNLLVICLRHSGCTFCRQTLADLSRMRAAIEAEGTGIALVHMGDKDPVDLLERYELNDLPRFRDPFNKIYEAFGLRSCQFRQIFCIRVIFGAIKAMLQGHRLGNLDGNGFQMPGVFLVRDSKIIKSYKHETIADRPEYMLLANSDEEANSQAASAPVAT